MSTHNVYFHGEIRKMLYGYPFLSEAMFFETFNIHNAVDLFPSRFMLIFLLFLHCWLFIPSSSSIFVFPPNYIALSSLLAHLYESIGRAIALPPALGLVVGLTKRLNFTSVLLRP